MDGLVQSSPKSEAVRAKPRKWSAEERQRIVQASLQAGTSVEAVARIYGVNASQLYDWRKQHRQRVGKGKRSVLLPVHVAEGAAIVMPETKQECSVVIEARSVRVTMSGCIDAAVMCTVLERLAG
jgi:transposase-like protein